VGKTGQKSSVGKKRERCQQGLKTERNNIRGDGKRTKEEVPDLGRKEWTHERKRSNEERKIKEYLGKVSRAT